jgi:hypothetical protein
MASKPVSMEFSKQSTERFDDLLKEMQSIVKKDMPTVLKFAAIDYTFSALRVTGMARGVPTRGFARAGWGAGLADLGKSPKAFYFRTAGQRWREFSDVKKKFRGDPISIEITNHVPFIEEMPGASSILPRAMSMTTQKYQKRLTRMSRKMAGKWAR